MRFIKLFFPGRVPLIKGGIESNIIPRLGGGTSSR
jgi:hypothetical protein